MKTIIISIISSTIIDNHHHHIHYYNIIIIIIIHNLHFFRMSSGVGCNLAMKDVEEVDKIVIDHHSQDMDYHH